MTDETNSEVSFTIQSSGNGDAKEYEIVFKAVRVDPKEIFKVNLNGSDLTDKVREYAFGFNLNRIQS